MAFIDWKLPSSARGNRMENDEISIVFQQRKYYSLTFNQTLSKEFLKLGYTRINIKQDDITGEIGIEINKENGLLLSKTGEEESSFNYKLNSKEWVLRLHKSLGLNADGQRYVLKLTNNLSRIDKCMFFRIIR